jgi:HlyD family secretion protein
MMEKEELMQHLPFYLLKIHPGGNAIFILLSLIFITSLVLLPLIRVNVSVSGSGIIRPLQERTQVMSSCTGIVDSVFVSEGDRIQQSAPLLRVRSLQSGENLNGLQEELSETLEYSGDLEGLIAGPSYIPVSTKYARERDEYLQRVDYLYLIVNKAEKELSRYENLFREGMISAKEYDDLVFAAEKAREELENYRSRTLNEWQNEYMIMESRLRKLRVQIRNTEEEVRRNTIFAPTGGNLVEFAGIYPGSAIQSGSVVGILSPDTGLIGEFFLSSENIAYIWEGQNVNLHLDAFTAREWGMVTGKVFEISKDFILVNNRPVYRIKCSLNNTDVRLRNGYTVSIRKGMTFRARCMVNKRSLFQLLYDRAEKWLYPGVRVKANLSGNE